MPFRSIRLAALLGAMAGAAALAAPVPTTPEAVSMPLGAVTVTALRDEINAVPNDGGVFGKDRTPQDVAAVLAAAGAPTDRLALGVDALLVRMPGRVVLIDTGLGPKVGGVLPGSLAKAGVAPDAVTDILVTHSHPDHVGGLVTADGALAFPRATIRMSAAEWRWMQDRPNNAALVRAIAGHVVPFDGAATGVPGITAVALPGHTPGHTGYEIASGRARLLDIGDTAHSAIVSLAQPDWTVGYDTDAAAGKAERRATLTRLAASHELVFAPHFPFPGFGRIVAKGDGFAWQPAATR